MGALLVGTLALLLSLARTLNEPARPTDLDQWYHAARAMLAGKNPYDVVGPAREFDWGWPLHYPLSTVLLTMPLTLFSAPVARVCFSTIGGSILGWALGKDHFRRIGLVLSAAFIIAVSRNQWSLFITAAFFVPVAVLFLAAKPNMALAYVAGLRSWRQARWLLGVGAVVVAVSLMARPSWPMEWLGALRQMEYVVAPVMRPYGALSLLALLKWRRADARIFLALVCVPQTPSLYDLLPLFVVMRTPREVGLLSSLTYVLFLAIVVIGPFPSFDRYAYSLGNLATFIIYFPVMIMLLRRPNVFEDEPPFTDRTMSSTLREKIERLPRVDALLLVANAAAAMLLLWVTLTTRRL
jgi:hypothetical protein